MYYAFGIPKKSDLTPTTDTATCLIKGGRGDVEDAVLESWILILGLGSLLGLALAPIQITICIQVAYILVQTPFPPPKKPSPTQSDRRDRPPTWLALAYSSFSGLRSSVSDWKSFRFAWYFGTGTAINYLFETNETEPELTSFFSSFVSFAS